MRTLITFKAFSCSAALCKGWKLNGGGRGRDGTDGSVSPCIARRQEGKSEKNLGMQCRKCGIIPAAFLSSGCKSGPWAEDAPDGVQTSKQVWMQKYMLEKCKFELWLEFLPGLLFILNKHVKKKKKEPLSALEK